MLRNIYNINLKNVNNYPNPDRNRDFMKSFRFFSFPALVEKLVVVGIYGFHRRVLRHWDDESHCLVKLLHLFIKERAMIILSLKSALYRRMD